MPMPTPEEVRTALKSFGTEIDNFNQSESGRGFKSERLKDGYCEGVSLDWIRRVLQGGRPSFSANKLKGSNPDYTFLLKKQSQAERKADAFLSWTPTLKHFQEHQAPRVKDTLVREWGQAKSNAIEKFEDLETDLFNLLNTTTTTAVQVELTPAILNKIRQCFGFSLGKMQNVDKIEQLYYAIPNKREAIENKRINGQASLDKVGVIVRKNAWSHFSNASEEKFSKKRSFKNVSLLSSQPMQQGLSLNGVLSKLLDVGTNDLKSKTAVKINIGGDIEGRHFFHSTASYLDPALENRYLFLDPNYGIFAYTEWKPGVMKAIAYLYTKVYCWTGGKPDRNVPITNYDLAVEVFGRRT